MVVETIDERALLARQAAHQARIDRLIGPHLARRAAGETHPVHDFMFTYYSFSPTKLRRWHPGFGVGLTGDTVTEYAGLRSYRRLPGGPVSVDPVYVGSQRSLIGSIARLLVATAGREPRVGCLGLHEWAMVYRLPPRQVRHASWPLRLGAEGTDGVVESHRISCSHFDAYRFFTESARPRNTLSPGAHDRADFEQPGCLHAGMDLYKHAYRLSPMIGSDRLAEAFELAWEIRIMDMRAAPYDLTGLRLDPTGEPWTPVRIETPEGKREYAAAQRSFAERGQAVRRRLIDDCRRLLVACEEG